MAADPRDIKTEAARQSIQAGHDMVGLYEQLPAGEAFDAKKYIKTDGGMASLTIDGKTQNYLETQFTTPGFKTKMQSLLTQFNDRALNWATSFYRHNNTKYTSVPKR